MEDIRTDALPKIWSATLTDVKKSTSESYFSAFLQDTKLISIEDKIATIAVKNVFIKAQIVARLETAIKKSFKQQEISITKIEYMTSVNQKPKSSNKKITPSTTKPTNTLTQNNQNTNLNSNYSFDNFINGFGTREIFAACQAISENPGRQGYNPLFIYGGVGLGKTHLIQATGNAIVENRPDLKVLYITANDFLSDFVDSLRLKSKFDDKYRSYDCLIIDDIQHFSGKERTQDSFFNTFNALYQNNKQIILSSDRPPSAIKTLADRLRSRFEQGLTFDIQIPDTETRVAIIKAKAEERSVPFTEELVEYIAKNCHTNVRELEGILNVLFASYELCQTEPTIDAAKNLIKGVHTKSRSSQLTPSQVIEKISTLFGIPVSEIRGTRQVQDIVRVRQLVMYTLYYSEGLSYPKIGSEFGKDHTTVMHAVRKIKKLLESNDTNTREQIDLITGKLYA